MRLIIPLVAFALWLSPCKSEAQTTESYSYYVIDVVDADEHEVASYETSTPPSNEEMQATFAQWYPGGGYVAMHHYNDPETGQDYVEFSSAGDFPFPIMRERWHRAKVIW